MIVNDFIDYIKTHYRCKYVTKGGYGLILLCSAKTILNLHPFPNQFIIKIIPFEKETGKNYQSIDEIPNSLIVKDCSVFPYLSPMCKNRPENIEVDITIFLNKLRNHTPHIIKYISSYTCLNKLLINLITPSLNIINKMKFPIYKHSNLLITPFYKHLSLSDYISKNYKYMRKQEWIYILFQIIYTLSVIQHHYPSFRHNDLSSNNIFVNYKHNKPSKKQYICYKFNDKEFYLKNHGIKIYIGDFDFANINGLYDNSKIYSGFENMGITEESNSMFDFHLFINYLYCNLLVKTKYNSIYRLDYVDDHIIDFIIKLIPSGYYGEKNKYTNYFRMTNKEHYPYKNIADLLDDSLFDVLKTPKTPIIKMYKN
jgi:hypothetical protein